MIVRYGRFLLVGVSLIFLGLLSIPPTVDHARDSIREARAQRADPFPSGVVRIGINPNNPPFAFYTPEGEMVGFEVDLARAIADEIGVEAVLVPVGFDALFDALTANRVDILIAALSPDSFTGTRAELSQPYYDAGLLLVNAMGWEAMRDVAGHALAFQLGSSADQAARDWSRRIAAFSLLPYETPDYALDAVRLGIAPAALVEASAFAVYRRAHPDWSPDTPYVVNEPYVVGVRAGASGIRREVNRAISALYRTGAMQTLIERWL